jgi:hypothetical protein
MTLTGQRLSGILSEKIAVVRRFGSEPDAVDSSSAGATSAIDVGAVSRNKT